MILSSCAITRPTRAVLKEKKEISYLGPVNYELEYEDLTGLDKTDPDFIDLKNTIEKDLQNKSSSPLNKNDRIKLKLIYYKCEFKNNYPTSSKGWNTLISVVTLGIYPIGEDRSCKTDLNVVNKSSGEVERQFSYTFDASTGGTVWIYAFPSVYLAQRQRIILPARVLINEFQKTLLSVTH